MRVFAIVVLLGALCSTTLATKSYSGYNVIRATPTNLEHVDVLRKLESQGISFWQGPSPPGRSSDILLHPSQQESVPQTLIQAGLQVDQFIPDLDKLIQAEGKILRHRTKGTKLEHDAYLDLESMYSWLEEQAEAHSSIASVQSIGSSFEGRDLKVLKISKGGDESKPIIWIDANIHAREWITSAVTLHIIDQLLNSNNTVYQKWTEDYDWYILTVHNPDGLVFTQEEDRMWRKTRSVTLEPGCFGADANRNYGYAWMTGGSSDNPCDYQTFAGHEAFSEVETKAVSGFLSTIADRLEFYLSLHSYSQLILIPYGVEEDFPQHEEYMRIGLDAAAAIARRFNTDYTPGNIVDLLYVASGGSMDWVKGVLNVPLTYTFELRDTGRYGFVLPPDQIIPSSEELLDGLEVIVDALRAGVGQKHGNVHGPRKL